MSETIWSSEPTEFHGLKSRQALLRDGEHCHLEWQDEEAGTWIEDKACDRMTLSWSEAVELARAILAAEGWHMDNTVPLVTVPSVDRQAKGPPPVDANPPEG